MAAKDIILNDSNDLQINSLGDFDVFESDQQHVILLINTDKGQWKQFPTVGVGIVAYIKSTGQQQVLKREITVQMIADGYDVKEVILKGNEIYYIDAKRITNE
jgi:hypothetical protein